MEEIISALAVSNSPTENVNQMDQIDNDALVNECVWCKSCGISGCAEDTIYPEFADTFIFSQLSPENATAKAQSLRRSPSSGMGAAVVERTIYREEDNHEWDRVAWRVGLGNASLCARTSHQEAAALREAISCGVVLMSGRHLQHGDDAQASRPMELFTNCSTSMSTHALFLLLLSGSGVGRCYDDDVIAIDWAQAPKLEFKIAQNHPDYVAACLDPESFARELNLYGGAEEAKLILGFIGTPHDAGETLCESHLPIHELPGSSELERLCVYHVIADSREGWANALCLYEYLAMEQVGGSFTLTLDFSLIRASGSPIAGMQGRPASGPLCFLGALYRIDQQFGAGHKSKTSRSPPWELAMRIDHELAAVVAVGGVRRSARICCKTWRDKDIERFVRIKEDYGMWSANNSVTVDSEFWELLDAGDKHVSNIFNTVTAGMYSNGEPGFINADLLDSGPQKSGVPCPATVLSRATQRSACARAIDRCVREVVELSRGAETASRLMITNPCGEISLHFSGGYCVLADVAPVLACPSLVEKRENNSDFNAEWDGRFFSAVMLATRAAIRINHAMPAIYQEEVWRTNRIGVSLTGIHEYAAARFGVNFHELISETPNNATIEFWHNIALASKAAKQEASEYSEFLGMNKPHTVTTIKPSGTISKIFSLTEGAHLPSQGMMLRWVQFRAKIKSKAVGAVCSASSECVSCLGTGGCLDFDRSDPSLPYLLAEGHPWRMLKSGDVAIVGFLVAPVLLDINRMDGRETSFALNVSIEEHYRWLQLLETHWIGKTQGNQVSYTLRVSRDSVSLAEFSKAISKYQRRIKCCSVLAYSPQKQGSSSVGEYEYLPEQTITVEEWAAFEIGKEDRAAAAALSSYTKLPINTTSSPKQREISWLDSKDPVDQNFGSLLTCDSGGACPL